MQTCYDRDTPQLVFEFDSDSEWIRTEQTVRRGVKGHTNALRRETKLMSLLQGLAAYLPFLRSYLPDEDADTDDEDATPLEPARVAVVGAGVGGCCAAYFLRGEGGEAVKVDVFERGLVGGRAATFTFQGHVYETGASIIHTSNKYLVDLSKEFGE